MLFFFDFFVLSFLFPLSPCILLGSKYAHLTLQFSMLELYDGKIRDLLSKDKDKGLSVTIPADKSQTCVKDQVFFTVSSPAQCLSYIRNGQQLRKVTSTNLNAQSSRSHCIYHLQLFDQNLRCPVSNFSIIDLAGAERTLKTGGIMNAQIQSETNKINASLSALHEVMHGKLDSYRKDNLTKAITRYFAGTARITMICNINPAPTEFSETVQSLRWAALAADLKQQSQYKTKTNLTTTNSVGNLSGASRVVMANLTAENDALQRENKLLREKLTTFETTNVALTDARQRIQDGQTALLTCYARTQSEYSTMLVRRYRDVDAFVEIWNRFCQEENDRQGVTEDTPADERLSVVTCFDEVFNFVREAVDGQVHAEYVTKMAQLERTVEFLQDESEMNEKRAKKYAAAAFKLYQQQNTLKTIIIQKDEEMQRFRDDLKEKFLSIDTEMLSLTQYGNNCSQTYIDLGVAFAEQVDSFIRNTGTSLIEKCNKSKQKIADLEQTILELEAPANVDDDMFFSKDLSHSLQSTPKKQLKRTTTTTQQPITTPLRTSAAVSRATRATTAAKLAPPSTDTAHDNNQDASSPGRSSRATATASASMAGSATPSKRKSLEQLDASSVRRPRAVTNAVPALSGTENEPVQLTATPLRGTRLKTVGTTPKKTVAAASSSNPTSRRTVLAGSSARITRSQGKAI